jgi:hypothetical protein
MGVIITKYAKLLVSFLGFYFSEEAVAAATCYFHFFFLIAFLKKVLIRNITVILRINYINIIYINNNNNNNNAVTNNNYGMFQVLVCFFKNSNGQEKGFL